MHKNILWLQKNSQYIKIDRVAKELKIPGRTLKAYVDGDRPLAEKWHDRIVVWVKNFR